MSDWVKLARAIAARTEPRFIEIRPEPRTTLRRTNSRTFIAIPRERGGGKVPFTEEQLEAMRGGLTAEEYRWKTIRKWLKAKRSPAIRTRCRAPVVPSAPDAEGKDAPGTA
ncbi:MAG: hypothetical protein ACRD3W_16275 [Terriglobales bacterium]